MPTPSTFLAIASSASLGSDEVIRLVHVRELGFGSEGYRG